MPEAQQRMATPTAELRNHIMNPNVPKNECEWWAFHEIKRMREAKDDAYFERNRVVAALASVFPSGIARTDIPGWEPEWHGCVFIDLPTGQVSWHYHDSQADLFEHLPPYQGKWDGHTTVEKYERVRALALGSVKHHG